MQQFTKENIQNSISSFEDTFYNAYDNLATEIYSNMVVPFCIKYKVSFDCGMGTYEFITQNNKRLSDIRERRNNLLSDKSKNNGIWKEYDNLVDILETYSQWVKTNPIGAGMEPFNIRDWFFNNNPSAYKSKM
jgi:hypothetical protein